MVTANTNHTAAGVMCYAYQQMYMCDSMSVHVHVSVCLLIIR